MNKTIKVTRNDDTLDIVMSYEACRSTGIGLYMRAASLNVIWDFHKDTVTFTVLPLAYEMELRDFLETNDFEIEEEGM